MQIQYYGFFSNFFINISLLKFREIVVRSVLRSRANILTLAAAANTEHRDAVAASTDVDACGKDGDDLARAEIAVLSLPDTTTEKHAVCYSRTLQHTDTHTNTLHTHTPWHTK